MRKRFLHSILSLVLCMSLLLPTVVYAAEAQDIVLTDGVQSTEETNAEIIKGVTSGKWISSGNRWWYQYSDGTYPSNELKEINGYVYYFDASGWMKTGWIELSDGWRYFDANGTMVTSRWISGLYYIQDNGLMAADQWIDDYYVDKNGKWVPGKVKYEEGWQLSRGRWWYQNADGTYPASELKVIDGETYSFDGKGWMQTGWVEFEDGWRVFASNGAMYKSCWYSSAGGDYYLLENGLMAVSQWIGKYYVGEDGKWIPDYKEYEEGWQLSRGRWWYQYSDGSYPVSELKEIEGKTYYFDKDGWMKTGWVEFSEGWRYFSADGAMIVSSWIDDTYYILDSGIMATNQWIGDFYVGKDGAWVPGYVEPNTTGKVYSKPELAGDLGLSGAWKSSSGGKWYEFSDGSYPSGGWIKIDKEYYYFDENGWLVTSQWIDKYKVDSNGIWQHVKVLDSNGKTYTCEREYLTDPKVDDMVFWTAIIYAESGDQGIPGMEAVTMSILNRMNSKSYGNDLRTVVYQQSQFQPARTGVLTKYLQNDNAAIPAAYRSNTRKAVQNALDTFAAYKAGTGTRQIDGIPLPEGQEFDYLYFMTPAAFRQCNLNESACDVLYVLKGGNVNPTDTNKDRGHVFFRIWKTY